MDIFIADAPKRLLTDFVRQDKQRIAQKIEQWVNCSDIVLSAKDRQYMLSCSHKKACQLRKNFERKSQAGVAASLDAQKIGGLLESLESLKLELELKAELLELLGQSELRISAYELLEIMFDIVMTHMYAEKWRVSEVDESGDFVYSNTVSRSQPTIEATIEWPTITASSGQS